MTTRPDANPPLQLMTVSEAAACLRMSVRTIRRRIKDGSLDVVRFDRSIRITQRDLERFISKYAR
ncbi:MAG: helix-turn-helix domain-containing protein [Alphaproteobacteria bacterium]|nr:helix-turn-helix domain-containing protein [Alphaproteobacteria bacterium]